MQTEVIARGRYDVRPDPGVKCTKEEDCTKQSFRDDCDINKILDRISKGAIIDRPQPQYGDFTNIPDFVLAHNIVQRAEASFMRIDPKIRVKFNNDPGTFLAFVQDPKNIDQMVEMGLATRRESPTPKEEVKTPPTAKETPNV